MTERKPCWASSVVQEGTLHTMIIDVLRMSSAMATMAELLRGERRERGTEEEGGGGERGGKGRRRQGLRGAGGEGKREEEARKHCDGCGHRIFVVINRGPNLLTELAVPTRQQVDAHFFLGDMGLICIGASAALMLQGSVRTTASASERARHSGERSRATFNRVTLGNGLGAKMHKRPTCKARQHPPSKPLPSLAKRSSRSAQTPTRTPYS